LENSENCVAEVRKKGSKSAIAEIKTEHEGRGRATFTPTAGQDYVLHITKPSGNYRLIKNLLIFQGILNEIPFPAVKNSGVTVTSTQDAYLNDEVKVNLVSSTAGLYRVSLYKKTMELHSFDEKLEANVEKEVTLNSGGAQGVLTVTVYSNNQPVAERLVFRRPNGNS
jgi:hypothetical protein